MSIAAFDDGCRSISGLARIFGRDRRTVTKAIQEHGIEPAGRSGAHATYQIGQVAAALFAPATGAANDEMTPKERLDHWRAENERIKHLRETGVLLHVEDVRLEVVVTLLKPVVTMLDSLPDRVDRRCQLSPEQHAAMCQEIDRERERLYQELLRRTAEENNKETDE